MHHIYPCIHPSIYLALYREAGVSSVRLIGSVNSSGFSLVLPDLGAGQLSGLRKGTKWGQH